MISPRVFFSTPHFLAIGVLLDLVDRLNGADGTRSEAFGRLVVRRGNYRLALGRYNWVPPVL